MTGYSRFDVKKGIGLTMERNEVYAWKFQPAPDTWNWSKVLPTAADRGRFVLVYEFGKVDNQGKMTETDHHYIHGLDLNPDAGKAPLQVELTKENSGSVLNLFALTGTTVSPEQP